MSRRIHWKITRQQVHDNVTGLTLAFGHESDTPILQITGRNREAVATLHFPKGKWSRRTSIKPLRVAVK